MPGIGFTPRFIYAKRPVEPGSYHVWTRDEVNRYLGRVYRVEGHKWRSGEHGPLFFTRESAARALAEDRTDTLQRLRGQLKEA